MSLDKLIEEHRSAGYAGTDVYHRWLAALAVLANPYHVDDASRLAFARSDAWKDRRLFSDLAGIAHQELRGETLSQQQLTLSDFIGGSFEALTLGLAAGDNINVQGTGRAQRGVLLATDIHTNAQRGEVLQLGIGPVMNIIVALPDGAAQTMNQGGIFSFYEFIHPINDRLTDDKWFEMIGSDAAPRRSPWTESFGADPLLDRPDHVRAGSGLAWLGEELVVTQDDANFLAIVDLRDWSCRAVTLPKGPGGLRLFGDDRGNKSDKWDLESGICFDENGRSRVVAFGSGSTRQRFHIIIVDFLEGQSDHIEVIDAVEFYEGLKACTDFAGSELNIEGASLVEGGQVLRLAQRGNGAPSEELQPVNALCDIDWSALRRYLSDSSAPAPVPNQVMPFELGDVDGVSMSFTELAVVTEGVFYLAAAEDTPNAIDDGPLVGNALGVIGENQGFFAPITMADGTPFLVKAEGLAIDPRDPTRAYLVTDRDDPLLPSQLCEVRLKGPWFDVV